MSQGEIRLEHKGPVAWVTVDNPARRNAICLDMWRQLDALLQQIDETTRCVVLRGAGEQAFVAGADISEFIEKRRSREDVEQYDLAAEAAMQRLYDMPQPTVAMISGYCIGGGVALALCCDIRIADETSQFAVPAARLGVGYGPIGLKRLLDVVSVPVATDIMVSARRYRADEALAIGLVNRVHPPGDLLRAVEGYADRIGQNAPLTVRATKRTIKELSKTNSNADLEFCHALAAQCFDSQDYLEGVSAFMEKREPRFAGN